MNPRLLRAVAAALAASLSAVASAADWATCGEHDKKIQGGSITFLVNQDHFPKGGRPRTRSSRPPPRGRTAPRT